MIVRKGIIKIQGISAQIVINSAKHVRDLMKMTVCLVFKVYFFRAINVMNIVVKIITLMQKIINAVLAMFNVHPVLEKK